MGKTSCDARRHIKEISELFGVVNTVGVAVVERLIERYNRKKYLRQSLQRLEARGLLQRSKNSYRLTTEGILFLKRYRNNRSNEWKPKRKWDGKWRLVSFDVPTRENVKRNLLRSVLRESGFFQLQKSVWIAPYEMSEDFWRFVVVNNLYKYCKIMLIQVLEGDGVLKKHFRVL